MKRLNLNLDLTVVIVLIAVGVLLPVMLATASGIVAIVIAKDAGSIVTGVLVISFAVAAAGSGIIAVVLTGKKARLARLQADFVANISHEFRTPLSAIRLYAQTLQSGDLSDDPEKTIMELAAGLGAVLSAKGPDLGKTAPRPMELPEPPKWMDSYEADLKAIQQDNTFSPGVEGFREEGMTSGTMSGLHIGEARQLFRPVTTRMSQQAAMLLNRAASIMEHLVEEPISVWLDSPNGREIISIQPDEWKGAYHFSVDLEPVDPTRDDRRGMLGLNYYTQQLLDPWTTLEDFLKVENADEVIKRIMKWKVMQSPEMMAIYARIAAEEIGVEDVLSALEEGATQDLDGPDAGDSGDFAPVDGAGIPEAGTPSQESELDFPTRNEPLTSQGRVGARVTEPLNTPEAGFRS